jgi:hypothetical protein
VSFPLQATIVDPRGINVERLATVIEWGYAALDGIVAEVRVGQGQQVDGYPVGTLVIVDRT